MRILLCYPGNAFSTVDVAIGYENALKIIGIPMDIYDYNNRLAFYDVALKAWEGKSDYRMKAGDLQALAGEALAIQALDFVPDAVVVVSGLALHPRAYELLYKLNVPLFLILTECPYIDSEQVNLVKQSFAAGVFVNDRSSVETIGKNANVPTCYLPHSYDPERHYPMLVGPEYGSDVYFYGTMWPERIEMVQPLMAHRNGWNMKINGAEFNGKPLVNIPNEELIKNYSGTKIAINHHRTIVRVKDRKVEHIPAYGQAWSIGPRAYEIAAAGAFQLCDDTRPELNEVFGESVPTYTDGADLLDKVGYFLAHGTERQELAREAHVRVQSCSFEERAKTILLPFIEEVVKHGSTITRT